MKQVLDTHYNRLADNYDEFLYYSPDFVRTLTAKMISMLDLQPEDRLADLGCGTGIYSLDILQQVPLRQPIAGVDPYASMLARIPEDANIRTVNEDALAFTARAERFDKVLIKETVHHIADRPQLFANLFEQLHSGGRLLLVHIPPHVQYPLFDAALERCLGWHADPAELQQQLTAAGFDVHTAAVDVKHAIPKQHYVRMVRHCYMSVLTSFTPEELEAGITEIEDRYADVAVLEFVDHFDYILAEKP